MKLALQALLCCLFLNVSPAVASAETRQVFVMGDSLFAANRTRGRSVAQNLARFLGHSIYDRSVVGARMIYLLPISGALGMSIPAQFNARRDWDWVVLSGGGNDLLFGCFCGPCKNKLNALVHPSGQSGRIPGLVQRIRKTGAKVIVVGYLRSPGISTGIDTCKDEGDVLEARLSRFAQSDPGVHYVSIADLVPFGDASFLQEDGVHPAPKASKEIARRVAKVILGIR